jgi:hypothetical protein
LSQLTFEIHRKRGDSPACTSVFVPEEGVPFSGDVVIDGPSAGLRDAGTVPPKRTAAPAATLRRTCSRVKQERAAAKRRECDPSELAEMALMMEGVAIGSIGGKGVVRSRLFQEH